MSRNFTILSLNLCLFLAACQTSLTPPSPAAEGTDAAPTTQPLPRSPPRLAQRARLAGCYAHSLAPPGVGLIRTCGGTIPSASERVISQMMTNVIQIREKCNF